MTRRRSGTGTPACLEVAANFPHTITTHPPPPTTEAQKPHTTHIAKLAFTAINPVKVLRRLTPSYFYPAPPPPPPASSKPSSTSTTTSPTTTTSTNTAKLSPTATLLHQRAGLTFAEPVASPPRGAADGSTDSALERIPSSTGQQQPPLCVQSAERKMQDIDKRRRRRSSSLMYQEPPESLEQQSDQATMPNLNSQWVNAKGMSMTPLHCIAVPSPCAMSVYGTNNLDMQMLINAQAPG